MSSEDTGSDASQVAAESIDAPSVEKMVPQSKVTELVANARLVAEQKARQESEARFAQEREQLMQQRSMGGMQQNQGMQAQQGMPEGIDQMVEQAVAKRDQALMQQQQAAQVKQLADKYVEGMTKGETLYPDFKEVMANYNPVDFSEITLAAATLDNTADVMYDIMKNPMKLTHLQTLFDRNKSLAYEEIKKLSSSIKRNEQAAEQNVKSPNPLSRPKASIAGADSGKKTIADWKRIWKA